jgi:DNA-binding LacI/PurR family transcriptional regulator
MSELKILSIPEQIAAHLRGEISRGSWGGVMPGRNELAKQFGVGITSVQEALRQLEEEGLLVTQGAGRIRRITASTPGTDKRRLKIAILAYEKFTMSEGIFSDAAHVLQKAGHDAFFAKSTLLDLKMDVIRVAKLVEKTEADAWIVCAAPLEITKWFASQSKPAFALFGRRRGLPLASVGQDNSSAAAAIARRLIEYGHQRIVILVRPDRRLPVPGTPERVILAELAAHGITPGPYNIPDWEDGIDGFQTRLESLFKTTPPTALIVDELMLFVATQQFLARKQLRVPEDISLVSMDTSSAFAWCKPSVAHLYFDRPPAMRRVVGWANNIVRGKKDLRETNILAEFIDGGTVGPVKR